MRGKGHIEGIESDEIGDRGRKEKRECKEEICQELE